MNIKKMMENMKKGGMKGVLIITVRVLGISGLIAMRKKKAAKEKMKGGCGKEGEMPMMKKMMPHCLEMVLPKLSKEDRNEFIMKMASVLFDKHQDK